MLGSVLPFTPELAERVSEYCEQHSDGASRNLLILTGRLIISYNSPSGTHQRAMGLDGEKLT
jgi:hypothetical protein